MTDEKFESLWSKWSNLWYENATCVVNEEDVPVRNLCTIDLNNSSKLHKNYETIKNVVKDCYFKEPSEKKLNRYKRAAVIAYTIIVTDPIRCENNDLKYDPLYLKQRLALYVALGSILQDYSQNDVENLLSREKTIFDFGNIGVSKDDKNDSFLLSIYKDLFYAEIYENFNVLTFANFLLVLVERASLLSQIVPIDEKNN